MASPSDDHTVSQVSILQILAGLNSSERESRSNAIRLLRNWLRHHPETDKADPKYISFSIDSFVAAIIQILLPPTVSLTPSATPFYSIEAGLSAAKVLINRRDVPSLKSAMLQVISLYLDHPEARIRVALADLLKPLCRASGIITLVILYIKLYAHNYYLVLMIIL